MIPRTEPEAWEHLQRCRYAKHGGGRSCATHDVYPAELPSLPTLPDIFDEINKAVERNDCVLMHEQFVALMTLQDTLAREHYVDCLYDDDTWEAVRCTTCGRPW